MLGRLLCHYSGVDQKRQVHHLKEPARNVIPAFARRKRAELIVMGTVGRTGIQGLFIGNTALALGWAALVGSFTLPSLLVGFAIGYAALWVTQPLFGEIAYLERIWRVLRLLVLFVYELIASSLRVVWGVVTPTHLSRPCIIAMPLDARSEGTILLVANLISLTPCSLSLDISPDRKTLYVHAIFVDDPDTLRRELKQVMERRMIEAIR